MDRVFLDLVLDRGYQGLGVAELAKQLELRG
jgi:hypothetical protein